MKFKMRFPEIKTNTAVFILAFAFAAFSFVFPESASAKIQFGEGDINSSDQILFTVRHDISGSPGYRTVFKTRITNGTSEVQPEILTVYPEKIELIKGGEVLQIRNRYGTGWYNTKEDSFEWKTTASKIPETSMRLPPCSASPDGKWLCYVEKKTYASGCLILENTSDGKKTLLDENASFSYKKVPAKWSADSSVLLYEKNSGIYFCNPEAVSKGIEAGEDYRKIGEGTIDSVCWTKGRNFIYIDSDIVYRINSKELYTLGLYSGIIGKGTAVGRLPYRFSPSKDRFSVNGNMTSIVVSQNGKNFTWYRIAPDATGEYLFPITSRLFISEKASLVDSEILWTNSDEPLIWIQEMPYGSENTTASLFRMNERFSRIISIENSKVPELSKDGSLCAFYSDSKISVYQTSDWKKITEISGEKTENAVWDNSGNLYAGGERTTKMWTRTDNSWKNILLSQAENAYWSGGKEISADLKNGTSAVFDKTKKIWKANGISSGHTNVNRNENYRVFTGETQNRNYQNALYARSLKGKATTKALLSESVNDSASGAPKKKIAFVFDAYDNADGIARILHELENYNLNGTFFLNGEFIRRYPNETKQIANSGNECASMFFTTANLAGNFGTGGTSGTFEAKTNRTKTENDYFVDENFIRRGLARNEDEFFQCTGKELSLYWHSPYYAKNEKIIQAGKNAGYTYADSMCRGLDIVTLEESVSKKAEYKTATQIIDSYMNSAKRNAETVISVAAGISHGERESYLYDVLDLLFSAVLDEGFEIVMLRDLIK